MNTPDILVSAADSVTIDTSEYRDLVKRSAYLDVILSFVDDPKGCMVPDIACIVSDLLKETEVQADDGDDAETGDADA